LWAGLKACATVTGAPLAWLSPSGLPISAASSNALRAIPIGDLAVRGDLPHLDGVVVIIGVDAARGDELRERMLHVSGFVRAARRDERLAAVPSPRPAEARVRAPQHRGLQLRDRPRGAAVDRHFDFGDRAASAPRETGQLVDTRTRNRLAA